MAYSSYIKLPNQGSMMPLIRLLHEMKNSDGYADENGFFSKIDIAEIAANALLITSGSRVGGDMMDLVHDTSISEELNSALQNTKMRMQLMRILGLVSTDYDSELYAITELGEIFIQQLVCANPNYKLLRELFMNITTTTEIYDHNTNPDFNCFLGYEICYALANLNYKIATDEMPLLPTYDIREIEDFIRDAKIYRENGARFPNTHPHFPKRQNGHPLSQPTNITRAINQILRMCNILAPKTVNENHRNFYVCTEEGRVFVQQIANKMRRGDLSFLTCHEFRKRKITDQQNLCLDGNTNLLIRAEIDTENQDTGVVFSPFQSIPETNICWLLNREIRKAPIVKEQEVEAINSQITLDQLRLKATYTGQTSPIQVTNELILQILQLKAEHTQEEVIEILYEQHKLDDKTTYYPFVHNILNIIGLDCQGEIGRCDAYSLYQNHVIPTEIKSPTEVMTYNAKSIRQAIENKILYYNQHEEHDIEFTSFAIGYNHPENGNEIRELIEKAKEEYNINIVACDIKGLLQICTRILFEGLRLDIKKFITNYGILYI